MSSARSPISTIPAEVELNYGLQSEFLAGLSAEQKLRIFDLTTRASRELHRWATKYPLIRRVRVWPLSLSVAAAAPFASAEALVSTARVSLWVFTIDDLFDEETVPFSELQRRVKRYKEIVSGEQTGQKGERDSLALALLDIRKDLEGYELFPALQEEWARAVHGTLNGMLKEHEWRNLHRADEGDVKLPGFDAYVENGLYTVGGPPHVWTALITTGDTSILEQYELFQELNLAASTCIRLANDLRSYEKEIREAKINSVVILQREALSRGCSPKEALAWACERVQVEIDRALTRCKELQRQARTVTGHPESAIVDIVRFVCDFYVHHDYHTFTTGAGRL